MGVAARHFILDIRADHLPSRLLSQATEAAAIWRLSRVRDILPASDRGPNHTPARFLQLIRSLAFADPERLHCGRPNYDIDRAVQEGMSRRSVWPDCQSHLQARGRRLFDLDARCLGCDARFRISNLLRFFRLYRHRYWTRPVVRNSPTAQLRRALQEQVHRRVLAPMAYLAVDVPARLSVHSTRR